MPIRKKGQKIFNVEEIASKADRDMNEINGLLVEELNSHFSLRADLKRYSNIRVKLENGEV
jgi:hypothetical protein